MTRSFKTQGDAEADGLAAAYSAFLASCQQNCPRCGARIVERRKPPCPRCGARIVECDYDRDAADRVLTILESRLAHSAPPPGGAVEQDLRALLRADPEWRRAPKLRLRCPRCRRVLGHLRMWDEYVLLTTSSVGAVEPCPRPGESPQRNPLPLTQRYTCLGCGFARGVRMDRQAVVFNRALAEGRRELVLGVDI